MTKKYKYTGTGMGLPGLPNEVTDDEAKALNMLDVLENAVKVGLYEEVKEPAPRKVQEKNEVKHG